MPPNQFLVTIDHLVNNHGLLDFSFVSIKHSNDNIHIHICDFLILWMSCSLVLIVQFPLYTFCFRIQKKVFKRSYLWATWWIFIFGHKENVIFSQNFEGFTSIMTIWQKKIAKYCIFWKINSLSFLSYLNHFLRYRDVQYLKIIIRRF